MGRRILIVLIALTGFILLNIGLHVYEKNRISQKYNVLEENIMVTDAERLPAQRIQEVLYNGANSPIATDFKNEIVQIINKRLDTDLTSDQLILKYYNSFITINFNSDNNISHLYSYYSDGYVRKVTSIERDKRYYMSACYNGEHIERSLDFDQTLLGNEFPFVLYSCIGALIFIVLVLQYYGQITYKDYNTGELVDINEFSMLKGILLKNLIICGFIILLPVFTILYFNTINDPQYINNASEKKLDKYAFISDEERLPIDLIRNTINDYKEELIKPKNEKGLEFNFSNFDVSYVSDNLQKLIDTFIAKQNNITDKKDSHNYSFGQINDYLTIHKDYIVIGDWSCFYTYNKDGYILKQMNVKDFRKINNFHLTNLNNEFIKYEHTENTDYNKWMMLIISWLCSLICFVFGKDIQDRKYPFSLWNIKLEKFVNIYGCNIISHDFAIEKYAIILFVIGIIAYLSDLETSILLKLIGIVAVIAYFEYSRRHIKRAASSRDA